MCMDGLWWGVPNEVWAAYYKKVHPELSVASLLDNGVFAEKGCEVTYPVAGAFTRFLIDTYGIDRYLELYKYKGSSYEDEFNSVFHVGFADVENVFWSHLRTVQFDALILEEMLREEGF